jgi:hypothetical protein
LLFGIVAKGRSNPGWRAKDLESADIDPHLMRCVLLAQWRFRSPPMMAFRLVEPHARAVPKQFYFLL